MSRPPGSFLVVGEALVDVVEDPSGRRAEHPGGSPLNVAVGLARLGRRVDLATWFGPDERGEALARHLDADGVGLTPGSRRAGRTSTATAHLDTTGQARYTFDLDWSPGPPTLSRQYLHVHTGSLGIAVEPGRHSALTALRRARASTTTSVDPNVRPDVLGDPATGLAVVEQAVALADVVKASDEDLAWLGGDDPLHLARRWLGMGPALVVVTRGEDGAVALTAAGGRVEVPAVATTVVDTVGAGDAFTSGLLDGLADAGLLGAGLRGEIARIEAARLETVLSRAARVAALTVARPGADPPRREDLG